MAARQRPVEGARRIAKTVMVLRPLFADRGGSEVEGAATLAVDSLTQRRAEHNTFESARNDR
jgi:hypothetical protein